MSESYTDNMNMGERVRVDVRNYLSELSTSNNSNQSDNTIMQIILRKYGFNKAVVIYGIVYLEGKGTRSAPPTSINAVAKMVLKMVES